MSRLPLVPSRLLQALRLMGLIALLAFSAGACRYESALESVACTSDGDCEEGAVCVSGYCVDKTTLPGATPTEDVGTPDASEDTGPAEPTVQSVTVTPAVLNLAAGGQAELTVEVRLSDDTIASAPTVQWRALDEAVATVSAEGMVSAVAPGTTLVIATSGEQSAAVAVSVTLQTTHSVEISPAADNLLARDSVLLAARALDTDGNELIGRTITWRSEDADVARVDADGRVLGVAPGQVRITAQSDEALAEVTLTVVPRPVASLAVLPAAVALTDGQSLTLTAFARDSFGESLEREVQFQSSDALVVQVDESGTLFATGPGSATVTVTSEGVSADVTVEVAQKPLSELTVSPIMASLELGTTLALEAAALVDGQTTNRAPITWESSQEDVASVSDSGTVTALALGNTVIRARSEGRLAEAFLSVVPRSAASLTVTPEQATLAVGASASFAAQVLDAASLPLSRTVRWSSISHDVATVDADGVVYARSSGSTIIMASFEGRSAMATVTVVDRPITGLDLAPLAATLPRGGVLQLLATVRANDGRDVPTETIVWTSSDPAVVTVDNSGALTALAIGSATITAQSSSNPAIVATTSVTVVERSVGSVRIAPALNELLQGDSALLEANVLADDGTALTGIPTTWQSLDTAIASVAIDGRVTTITPGSTTVRATSEGVTGEAYVVVRPRPVSSVAIAPAVLQLVVRNSQTLSASVQDDQANTLTDRDVYWSSSDAAVASVTNAGVVTARSAGQAIIFATSEGVLAQATVTVTARPVNAVSLSPTSASIQVDASTSLTPALFDDAGTWLEGRTITWSSSNNAVASVNGIGLITGVSTGTALVRATSEGKFAEVTVTVTPKPVATVALSLPSATLVALNTQLVTATLRAADNSILTGRTILWSSANTAVATVTQTGSIKGVAPGATTVRATSEGQSAELTVTVTARPVDLVVISPDAQTLVTGTTANLTASIFDNLGNYLGDRSVTWSSGNEAVATVEQSGTVTGVAEGTTTITATSEGKTAQATITVLRKPVDSVTLSSAAVALIALNTTTLNATLKASDNATLTGRDVVWFSANTAVATVSQTGVVTGVGPGITTVSATSEGKSAQASVTVTARPVNTVTVTPATAEVIAGQTTTLSAATFDDLGNRLTGRTVTWSSSSNAIATVNASGTVSGVAEGTTTITATSEGKTAQATITVLRKPVNSVALSATSLTIVAHDSADLTATLRASDNAILTGRDVVWFAAHPEIATVSQTGTVTGVSPGSTTVSATSEGKTAQASITVLARAVETVVVTPSAAQVIAGQATSLTATTFDYRDNLLTGRTVTWSSSSNAVATVNASGTVTGVAQGTATITATSEGMTAQATITVLRKPVDTVTLSDATLALEVDDTETLTATLKASDNTTLAGRDVVWVSADTSVATVSQTGVVTGVGAGSTTITATSEGKSAQATVTVTARAVATVTVTPSSATLVAGATLELAASVRDDPGKLLDGRTITWASDNANVAAVNAATGVVTAVAPGSAIITATSEGQTDQAVIAVTPMPVSTIELGPTSPEVAVGGTLPLTPTLRAANNDVLTGRTILWFTSDPAIVTVNGSGVVSALTPGTATITAVSEGKTATIAVATYLATDAIQIDNNGITEVEIFLTLSLGADTTNNGTPVTRPITWTSSDPTIATVDENGLVTGVAPGQATITATSDGISDNLNIDVTFDLVEIAAGAEHTCAITAHDKLFCWGQNTNGQLGIGTTTASALPARVAPNQDFQQVAAGNDHTCALDATGKVWCWGKNTDGQLGDNSTTERLSPVAVSPATVFDKLSTGSNHTCAIKTDNTAWCWGDNASGQLGDNSTTDRTVPTAVSTALTFDTISAGRLHTCALAIPTAPATDRPAYCWGSADLKQNSTNADSSTPVQVSASLSFRALTAGDDHTCAIHDTTSEAYCWGDNSVGQLGRDTGGDPDGNAAALAFSAFSLTFSVLEAGATHTCGLFYCWGKNDFGQLGIAKTTTQSQTPVNFNTTIPFGRVASGTSHTCGIEENSGIAYCWGRNNAGQLAIPLTTTDTHIPGPTDLPATP